LGPTKRVGLDFSPQIGSCESVSFSASIRVRRIFDAFQKLREMLKPEQRAGRMPDRQFRGYQKMADRSLFIRSMRYIRAFVPAAILAAACFGSASAFNVTTYHYDNSPDGLEPQRNGSHASRASRTEVSASWPPRLRRETSAPSRSSFKTSTLGAKARTTSSMWSPTRTTVDAFDATSGAKPSVGQSRHAAAARHVSQSASGRNFESTPVIDIAQNAIYLVTCTYENNSYPSIACTSSTSAR
jgi:hypothetical protein